MLGSIQTSGQTPALATAGVTGGGAMGSALVGMVIGKLIEPGFTFAKDWNQLLAYVVAAAISYAWAYKTATRDDVTTGIKSLDK